MEWSHQEDNPFIINSSSPSLLIFAFSTIVVTTELLPRANPSPKLPSYTIFHGGWPVAIYLESHIISASYSAVEGTEAPGDSVISYLKLLRLKSRDQHSCYILYPQLGWHIWPKESECWDHSTSAWENQFLNREHWSESPEVCSCPAHQQFLTFHVAKLLITWTSVFPFVAKRETSEFSCSLGILEHGQSEACLSILVFFQAKGEKSSVCSSTVKTWASEGVIKRDKNLISFAEVNAQTLCFTFP